LKVRSTYNWWKLGHFLLGIENMDKKLRNNLTVGRVVRDVLTREMD
jgi:hypothetical protein